MARKSKDGWELWERVKQTAVPLNANRAGSDFSSLIKNNDQPVVEKAEVRVPRATRIVKPYISEPEITVSLASKPPRLDEATARKIARGKTSIDGRIDLHGMTQVDAQNRLFHFIEAAFAANRRTVLVITGKGVRSEGVLKQAVPRWLSEPIFREKVIGYREAHITHGGSGALYVRLRNANRGKQK
ncbi:MAG: Smr/MutS family protein [Pseudomonadota bacterium]